MSSAKSRSQLYADYAQIYLALATQETHNPGSTMKLLRCNLGRLLGLSIAWLVDILVLVLVQLVDILILVLVQLVDNLVLVLIQLVSPSNVYVFVDAFISLFIWNKYSLLILRHHTKYSNMLRIAEKRSQNNKLHRPTTSHSTSKIWWKPLQSSNARFVVSIITAIHSCAIPEEDITKCITPNAKSEHFPHPHISLIMMMFTCISMVFSRRDSITSHVAVSIHNIILSVYHHHPASATRIISWSCLV